ncbi:hypothetical protein [Egbenema bharatensis]|uniref:hypothetical protein n=1 Tax=Egbenema bharatensis TaxID=3463334 RepID=UPI003A879BC4
MNEEQEEALRILFGELDAELINAWCRVTQHGDTLKWLDAILLTEIFEAWDGDVSDCPNLDLRDKLTLDHFAGIGFFSDSSCSNSTVSYD